MQVRAITVGVRVGAQVGRSPVQRAGAFAQAAKRAYEAAGFPVQTVRLATQPLSEIVAEGGPEAAVEVARRLEDASTAAGMDYCSLGPVLAAGPGDAGPLIAQVSEALAQTQRTFLSVLAATSRDGINLKAVRQTAEALVRIGRLDGDGSASRRFALSANVPPHGPFFPSAYHRGRRPGFSIAVEAADLAVTAFRGARDLPAAAEALTRSMEEHGGKMARIGRRLAARHGFAFHGIDISPAPFPEEERSIGAAIEALGVEKFGARGTLFAAAFIVEVLRQTRIPKTGFSGLMVPLLEDAVMAARHAEGTFNLDSLLLYSAVCGAGLDTIPIPGDSTADEIAAVYLDLCSLAVALRKPLTARLMPIRGRRAGDRVEFDFPYFAPTTVATLLGGAHGKLAASLLWRPAR